MDIIAFVTLAPPIHYLVLLHLTLPVFLLISCCYVLHDESNLEF